MSDLLSHRGGPDSRPELPAGTTTTDVYINDGQQSRDANAILVIGEE